MHTRNLGLTLGITLLAVMPSLPQDYVPRSLPSLGGGHTSGSAMNSKGEVAGYTLAADNSLHSFFWSRQGGMVDLLPIIGQNLAIAGLNTADTIAGYQSNIRAVTWDAVNGLRDLGTLGGPTSFAEGISEGGLVVGCADKSPGIGHAFVWTPLGGMQDLDPDPNGLSCALATSANGTVTGQIGDGKGSFDVFLWTQLQGLVLLGLGPDVHPRSVNNSGAIAGYYLVAGEGFHAFYWSKTGGLEDLGRGFGVSVNNRGQVLFDGFGGPFLWSHASGTHRVPQLGTGWGSVALNDAGQILIRASERTRVMTPAIKVSLTSSANPSQAGQSVTFTATATSVQGPPPDGELIIFRASNKVLGKVPLAGGVASISTSKLAAGSHNITAQYVGDVNYFARKSPPLTQIVNP